MDKRLTQPWSYIDPLSVFKSGGFEELAQIQRTQTGGMSRADFLNHLFGSGEPGAFPVGHLMDHRVRMPEELARSLLARGPDAIKQMLNRIMCMSDNPQAAGLVCAAIGRSLDDDAELISAVNSSYPEFSYTAFSGRLGDFSKGVQVPSEAVFRRIVGMMAVYYGSLELQLISLRQASVESYRIGLEGGKETATIGQHATDVRQLYESLRYVALSLRSTGVIRGRRPEIINQLRGQGEKALSDIRKEFPSLSDSNIIELVKEIFLRRDTVRVSEEKKLEKLYKRLAQNPRQGLAPLRKLSTTVACGVQAGIQIAFAIMRLMQLADGISRIICYPGQHKMTSWQDCFGNIPVINERAAGLYLVQMRLLRKDSIFGSPFASNGSHADLLHQMRLAESFIGSDTFQSVREKHSAWFSRKMSAARGRLVGSAQWDILPCFRFSRSVHDTPWVFRKLPTSHELMTKALRSM